MWECIACGTGNIDTNSVCEICGNSEKPILTINRHQIDFGALNRAGTATAIVQIKNTGIGILNGDISTSAPDYIRFLSPSRFSLAPSESILISIALTQNAPRPENGKQCSFSNWISISSNGGNEILDGEYSSYHWYSYFWFNTFANFSLSLTNRHINGFDNLKSLISGGAIHISKFWRRYCRLDWHSNFWLKWAIVTAVPFCVIAIVFFIIASVSLEVTSLLPMLIIISIVFFVLFALQSDLLYTRNIHIRVGWIVNSSVGLIGSFLLIWILIESLVMLVDIPPSLSGIYGVMILSLALIVIGLCVGFSQAIVMRRYHQPLWKWALITTIGLLFSLCPFAFLFFVIDPGFWESNSSMLNSPVGSLTIFGLVGLISGSFFGLFTGIPLQRIYLEE